jgi:hypothetical protein
MLSQITPRRSLALTLLVALLLSACSAVIASPTPVPPTFTPPPPTDTPLPPTPTATDTLPPPTETPTHTPLPSETPTITFTPLPSETPSPSATPSGEDAIYIYYIQRPEGKGCGGSPVKVNTGIHRTEDAMQDVKTALSRLFAFHTLEWGNLYNPWALSSISVADVGWGGNEMVIQLTGDLVRTGDPCDSSRMRTQVWTTARQFPEFKQGQINIFLNSSLLGDLLEGK